jgi:hypothetical protein
MIVAPKWEFPAKLFQMNVTGLLGEETFRVLTLVRVSSIG